jgi:hypothetical protein
MPDDIDPDPISRSLKRHGGIAGSPLEKAIRHNAYKLIDTGDGSKTDSNLDNFVIEQRADPFYASSFTLPPVGAAVTSKATVVPSLTELTAMAASGKVPSSATPAKAEQSQQTVQPTATEFDEMRRSGKVAVGK